MRPISSSRWKPLKIRCLTIFFWVLQGLNGFLLCLNGFYWVLLDFTGFYWILQGFTGFYLVLLGFTGYYWVLLVFFWVFIVSTCFYLVFIGFWGCEEKSDAQRRNQPQKDEAHELQKKKRNENGNGRLRFFLCLYSATPSTRRRERRACQTEKKETAREHLGNKRIREREKWRMEIYSVWTRNAKRQRRLGGRGTEELTEREREREKKGQTNEKNESKRSKTSKSYAAELYRLAALFLKNCCRLFFWVWQRRVFLVRWGFT